MSTMTMDISMRARSAVTHAVFLAPDAWLNRRTFGIALGVAVLVFALGARVRTNRSRCGPRRVRGRAG